MAGKFDDQFEDAEMLSDAEAEDSKAEMLESSSRRSSDKLDCLAELAASLLNQDKKPAPSVSFQVGVVEKSKPLKKRKIKTMAEVNSAWMERISLKPRVGEFEAFEEEHLFKTF